MAQIVLNDVWKVYADGTEAVRALDLQIEVRNVLEPGGLEPTIDVVLFLCFLHGHILSKKSLDVKTLYCYLSTSST